MVRGRVVIASKPVVFVVVWPLPFDVLVESPLGRVNARAVRITTGWLLFTKSDNHSSSGVVNDNLLWYNVCEVWLCLGSAYQLRRLDFGLILSAFFAELLDGLRLFCFLCNV